MLFNNLAFLRHVLAFFLKRCLATRGESKPERRSGKRIVAGTAFRLEFQVH